MEKIEESNSNVFIDNNSINISFNDFTQKVTNSPALIMFKNPPNTLYNQRGGSENFKEKYLKYKKNICF